MYMFLFLQLHEGIKKSGIMGFFDPSPGEKMQLYVEYTYGGNKYEVFLNSLIFIILVVRPWSDNA